MASIRPWMIGAMVMTAVLVNASDYSFLVPLRDARITAHQEVVARAAPSPARYRLLVPLVLDVPIRWLSTVMPYDKAFGRTYAVFYFAALTVLLMTLVHQLSMWFTAEQALVGALLVGSTIRMALRQGEYLDLSSIPLTSVFAPHSLFEPTFVAAGFVLALSQRTRLLAALVAIAALNSEASVILAPLYVAVSGVSRRSTTTALIYTGIWGTVTIAIRLMIGQPDVAWSFGQLWQENMAHLPTALINVALFIGPLWILAVLGFRRAPAPIRRAAWLIPGYLAPIAIFGYWWDVRLLMALYPLLFPLILSALFSPRSMVQGSGVNEGGRPSLVGNAT